MLRPIKKKIFDSDLETENESIDPWPLSRAENDKPATVISFGGKAISVCKNLFQRFSNWLNLKFFSNPLLGRILLTGKSLFQRFSSWLNVKFFSAPFSGRLLLTGKNLFRRFFHWLNFPVPRWRPAVAMILLFAMLGGMLIYGGSPGYAATYTFAQSSWSGGSSATTAVHPTNQTGWNKYSAATNISAGTTVATGTFSTTKNENFSTTDTTADKDSGATTATWNASTTIQIPAAPTLTSYYKFDEGSGVTATDSSGNGNTGTLNPSPMGYWKFDEGSETSATDSSGNNATGTITGGTYSSTVPTVNFTDPDSLTFNGTSTHVDVSSFVMSTINTSVSAWVYPTGAGAIVSGGVQSTEAAINSDGSLQIGYPTTGSTAATAAGAVAFNTWSHIVFVWPTSITAGGWSQAKIYVNGALVADDGGSTNTLSSTSSLRIGASQFAGCGGICNQFAGKIDDLAIYNRALSAGEVSVLAGGYPSDPPTYSSTIPTLGFSNSKSLNFTSGSDYVDLGSYNASHLSTFSFGGWVYLNSGLSANSQMNIMGWGSSSIGGSGILLEYGQAVGGSQWQVQRNGTGILTTTVGGANGPAIGQWYHAMITYTGSLYTLYINGVSVNSTSSSSNPGSGSNFIAGNNPLAISTAFNGKLDDIRFYGTALSSTQVATLAAGGETNGGGNDTAQSIKVNTGTEKIKSVTLTKSDTPGTGTVTYYVSNDGGSTFNQVTPASEYPFSTFNNDLRWKIVLTGNATVSSISLVYTGYYASADLTSSAYDTSDPTNLVAKIAWTATGETSNETVKFQIRTSADGVTWSGWCGASDTGSSCAGSNYFTSSDNNVSIGSSNPVRSGGDDEWFEYKAVLASGGGLTATISNVTVTYVVNAAPEFNTPAVTVSQITDSTDSNYGKVAIVYSIRDSDTSTGTTNAGFITPSFEYNIGGGYIAITSGYLSANATALKAVNGTTYTDYTAYWDAKSQIPTNYLTTAKVRVTINDNEAANNTANSASANFTLDTKNPTVTAFTIDGTQNQVTLNTTDDTALQYMLSNNADFSADGLNSTSGQWQDAGGTSITINIPWNFATTPVRPTVYLQVRDTTNNTTSTSAVAPSTPDAMYIRDISDAAKSNYEMFVSWNVYTSAAGATFANYKVYRSTDGSSYSLLSTITDRTINYVADFNLTGEQTYYYKVKTTDADTDISPYSEVVSQAAHGTGGGTDNVDPVISAVTVAETQSTYAKITWTTDVLADSRVDYSISPDSSFALGGTSVASFVTTHSVTVNNLTPNTTYLFKVRSTDPVNNTGSDDNGGAGFTFTTTGGPVITNVTQSAINDNSADIVWNTDRDADSYVTYSTNSDLSSSTRVGSSGLVGGAGPLYNHKVSLTGLSSGTQYYYFAESTDATANYSKDNNGGNYYVFTTPVDSTPPVISGVTVPVTALTAAVIIWQTDKPATTQMSYGTTSGVYSTTTVLDSTLTLFHVVALDSLDANVKYYFVVKSSSASGHEAISNENSFTTDKATVITSGGGTSASSSVSDTTSPTISNIKTQNVTSFKADVSFNTNEESIGVIQYGADSDILNLSAADPIYSQNHTVSLAGLATGTTYTFKLLAIDKAGNIGESDVQTFKTKFFTQSTISIDDASAFQKEVDDAIEAALPSLAPPFIEQPRVTAITDSSATITWRTNVKAYSAVAYGTDAVYDKTKDDPYETEVSDTTNKVTIHSLDLKGLTPDTLYHFSVHAFTLPQLQSRTDDMTFATEAPKIQAHIGEVKNDSFRAMWTTADRATSVVQYRNLKTGETNQKAFEEKTIDHDVLVDNLTPGTSYEVNVFGVNERGNKVSIVSAVRVTTSVDVFAPKITELKISSAFIPGSNDKAQTIISWKTNEPSNSVVFYKDGSALPNEELPNKVETKEDFITDHAVVLSTLKPGGLYSIKVKSTDRAGNTYETPTRTIVVPLQAQSVLDIVFKNFEETFQFLKNINH
ncbi:fibronectin type III domain-containing protein [Candidatus Parcubacteria bacterium]|nr:fibronectin type III domain-containing protein [Candidatus Parcubacteria bacterium]